MRFSLKQLLAFVGIAACVMVACRLVADFMVGEERKEYEHSYFWYDNIFGIAEQTGDPSSENGEIVPTWDFDSVTQGNGTLIHLNFSHFVTHIGDGGYSHEIAIQLPAKVIAGDRVELLPITKRSNESTESARRHTQSMHPGEVTILEFSNPALGRIRDARTAPLGFVEVIELSAKSAIIRLSINAELSDGQFELDRKYKLTRLEGKQFPSTE